MADGQIRTGSPEDLVLGDAFEATFHKDGLRFDKHTGTFSIERHHRQAVHVIGDGIASVWTCRALERLRYVVDVTADVTITIQSAGDDTVWQLSTDPHNTSYHSISQVLQVLEEQQHDGSG
jgi:iron complex transport system ATP-binding protein